MYVLGRVSVNAQTIETVRRRRDAALNYEHDIH